MKFKSNLQKTNLYLHEICDQILKLHSSYNWFEMQTTWTEFKPNWDHFLTIGLNIDRLRKIRTEWQYCDWLFSSQIQIQCIKPKIEVVGKLNFIENPVFDLNNFLVWQLDTHKYPWKFWEHKFPTVNWENLTLGEGDPYVVTFDPFVSFF